MTEPSYPSYSARRLILGLILFGAAAGAAPCQESHASLAKRGEKAGPNQSAPTLNISLDSANTLNSKHIIGRGNLLDIHVLHEAHVPQKVPIPIVGQITIGEIQASGMMPDILQATIAQNLPTYANDAEVTAVVEEMKRRPFSVKGEVEHPAHFRVLPEPGRPASTPDST